MCKIIEVAVRQRKSDGMPFLAFILAGTIVPCIGKESKIPYFQVPKVSIPTYGLTAEQAKLMVGESMPGNVTRVPCKPYEWLNPRTGEKVKLTHTYAYTENVTAEPVLE